MSRSNRSKYVLAAAAAMALPLSASAADKHWNKTGSGTWGTAANWSPNGMPGSGDNVFIGDNALINNAQVYLNTSPLIAKLTMTNGMFMDTTGFSLQVSGTTKIDKFLSNPSRMLLRNAVNPFDLHTKDLVIAGGGCDIWMVDNPTIFVTGKATVEAGGSFFGGGVINFTGNTGPVLVMDGKFTANGISHWTLNQQGTGKIDLDGSSILDTQHFTTGNGTDFSGLTVNGTGLFDEYDDVLILGPGNKLNMNLSEGWTLGGNGVLAFNYRSNPVASEINGGTLTVFGTIEFEDFNLATGVSKAAVNAPVIFHQQADVLVGGRDVLDINNSAVINGGSFLLSGQGNNQINFNGATQVKGGTFTTNAGYTNSFINFNGATEWAGTVIFNGDARQNGNATVVGTTVINARKFDMDGETELARWNIGSPFTINAQQLDINDNLMSGTISVNNTLFFPGSLTVNLPPGQKWTAGGRVNLTGSGFGVSTTLAGSDVAIAGELHVTKANAISARTDFLLGSLTTINTDSALHLTGGSLGAVNTIAGATITGPGKLQMGDGKALHGFGTIASGMEMTAGSELKARDGTLTLSGPITSLGVVGTANANSTLSIPQTFNTNKAARMDLNGGTVTGTSLLNDGEIRGRGTINSAIFTNNGSISAITGGTLTINSGFLPDLDGPNDTGVINVTGGNFRVTKQLADAFDGTINLKEGQLATFDGGWTLGTNGQLNAQVGPNVAGITAVVVSPTSTIAGTVHVPSQTRLTFHGKADFTPSSITTLDTGTSAIELNGDSTIAAGAAFVTPSAINGAIEAYAKLDLASGANIAASVKNFGTLSIADENNGQVTIEEFNQFSGGHVRFNLRGPTPGTQHDRIVAGPAELAGQIGLDVGAYIPDYLVPHELIHASGGISDRFENVTGLALSPTRYLAVTYTPTRVFATAAIPGDANLDGTVGIADFAILAANFNAPGSWSQGSFDGNLSVDIGDFSLLAMNFNLSIPGSLSAGPIPGARGNLVPEPGSAVLVGLAGTALVRRRRAG